MSVVILRSGVAVKTSNIQDWVTSIDGFLSSFKVAGKAYSYFNAGELISSNGKEQYNTYSGYYEVEAYSKYILNPGLDAYNILSKDFRFDNKFVPADDGQQIIVKVAYLQTPYHYYDYITYTFNHVKDRNYLKKGKYVELDFSLMGTPSTRVNTPGSTLETGFFNRHIAQLPLIPADDKAEYARLTIICTLRIAMIKRDVFPILLNNPSNFNLSSIQSAIIQMEANWQNNVCFETFSVASSQSYNSHLATFYTACFKNQGLIKNAGPNERMRYVIDALPDEAVYLISNNIMLDSLKAIANKPKRELTEADRSTVIKIVMSFNETDPVKIDSFLDGLVSVDYSLLPNEDYETFNSAYADQKITLFERIYGIFSKGMLYKLWHYSPLYKKMHTALDAEEKASERQIFVTCIYVLWVKSKYNPYRNNLFNENYIGYRGEDEVNKTFLYTRDPATTVFFTGNGGWRLDYYETNAPLIVNNYYYKILQLGQVVDSNFTNFHGFNQILIRTNEYYNLREAGTGITDGLKSQMNLKRNYEPYGFYHLYQPIQVINVENKTSFEGPEHKWNDAGDEIRQTYQPSFLYHFFVERKRDEFVYSLIWELVGAAYDGLPASKFTKFIDKANKTIDDILDTFGDPVPKTVIEFINDYSSNVNKCPNNPAFCRVIRTLDTWLQNYVAVKNGIVFKEIKLAAKDVVDYADPNNWPSDFDIATGLDAKIFIRRLSNIDISGYENDRKNDILIKIKKRVEREEPTGNITKRKEGFSLYKWVPSGTEYTRTSERLHTDAVLLELIDVGIDSNVPDHWIEGILAKAFRIKKSKTRPELEEELQNASKLLRPLTAPGGRNGLLYCFHDITERTTFENLVKQNYIDKYRVHNIIAENGSLSNTYYGGSVHTKILPPDIDMVSYISIPKMLLLKDIAVAELDTAYKIKIIRENDYKRLINSIKRSMDPSLQKQPSNIRIMSYQITKIVILTSGIKRLHYMSEEYRNSNMNATLNGVTKNILEHLNLDSPLNDRFDFVFITKEAAKEGRSIPPETQVRF